MHDEITKNADEAAADTASLDLSKLFGFQHLAADTAEESFAEEAAATFNKIGDLGEGGGRT